MKLKKLKHVKIYFNSGAIKEYELFEKDNYIETYAKTIKGEEVFHVIIHYGTNCKIMINEHHITYLMKDIDKIIQEWR